MTPYARFLCRFDSEVAVGRHQNRACNSKAAVIMESRPDFFLPLVIKNFKHFLGQDWNFYFFYDVRIKYLFDEHFSDWDVEHFVIDHQQVDLKVINQLRKQESFWQCFGEDVVLVFEADTICCRPLDNRYLEFDYIGAPCGVNDEILNGGLSLRRTATMIDAVRRFGHVFEGDIEDVFFTRALREMGARLPNRRTAIGFAVESYWNSPPFGVHGTTKYWHNEQTAERIVNSIIL